MAVSYKQLFQLISDKGISETELMKISNLNQNNLLRLKNNRHVSIEVIESICLALQRDIEDVLEFIDTKTSN